MKIFYEMINMYPHPISLQHNSKSLFYSVFGFIFSTISYALILALIYYFSYDLLNFTNPNVKISQSKLFENIRISTDELINSIDLDLHIRFNINNNIFDPEVILTEENFKLSITSSDEFGDQKNFIKSQNYNCSILNSSEYNYLCKLNFFINNGTQLKSSSIVGDAEISNNITKGLKDINLKINEQVKILFEYKKPNQVKKYDISMLDYTIEIYDDAIDPENFRNFSNKFLDYYYNEEKMIFQNIIYRVIEFRSDNNRIFPQFQKTYIPQIDYSYTDINDKSYYEYSDFKILMSLSLRNIMHIYIRVYKKILDLISALGGIFNPILILGRILVFKFNEKKYKLHVLNHLFTGEDISREINKSQKINDNQEFKNKKNRIFHKSKTFNFYLKKDINLNNNIEKRADDDSKCYKKEDNKHLFKFNEKDEINKTLKNLHLKKEFSLIDNTKAKNFIEENLNHSQKIHDDENEEKFENNIYPNSEINHINLDNIQSEFNTNQIEVQIVNNISSNESKEEKTLFTIDENCRKEIQEFLNLAKNRDHELLRYNFTDFVKSIICFRKKLDRNLKQKEDIYEKILIKLNFYFEITNIMRLYESFEKMKFILFNANQIHCFDYMIHDVNYNSSKKEEETLFELFKYFQIQNRNFMDTYFDESIKIIMKNEIKNMIIKK